MRRGSRPRPSLSTRHPRPHLSPRRPRPPHPTSSSPTPPHVIRAHLSSVILALEARICSGSDNARSRREADPRVKPEDDACGEGSRPRPSLSTRHPRPHLSPRRPRPLLSSAVLALEARICGVGARAPLAGQGRASNDAQRTSMEKDIWLYLAKLAGAAAGAMISLVYLVPKGRREAASRFLVGLASRPRLRRRGRRGARRALRARRPDLRDRRSCSPAPPPPASAPGGCSARFRASPSASAAGESARPATTTERQTRSDTMRSGRNTARAADEICRS